MECTEIHFPGGILLRASGRVDLSSADAFRDALLRAVSAASRTNGALIVDFSGLDYISSAGLRSLMIAEKFAKTKGARIGIAAMQPVVKEIFAISRFDMVFPCFDTLDAAKENLAPLP